MENTPTAATGMPQLATYQRTRLCKAVWTDTLTAKIWQQMDAALECKDIAASLALVVLHQTTAVAFLLELEVLLPVTPVAVRIQLQLQLQLQRLPLHATLLATAPASYQVMDAPHVASAVVEM